MFNRFGDGIQRAHDKTKNLYPTGKKYGDGYKEVARGAAKGAVISKTVLGAAQEAVLNSDTVILDTVTTVKIADELAYDAAEEIIDNENEILDGFSAGAYTDD
jgi:hypothetical protein